MRTVRERPAAVFVVAVVVAAVLVGAGSFIAVDVAGAAAARPSAAAHLTVVPRATTSSIDPYGPLGMNIDAAHATTSGDPSVVVAYVEGGINWYGPNASALADSVYVNWHETPVPCKGATVSTATMVVGGVTEACSTYYSSNEDDYDTVHPDCLQHNDCDVTAANWASDPRVKRQRGLSFITPEDLIAAFSGRSYNPPAEVPAAFPKAISGWDFYDTQQSPYGQNDPATVDASYAHSDDQMSVIHTICPRCLILPVKAGDEATDSTEALAKAWLFAYQSGARVIVSVTADLGYSSFAREVLAYLDSKGVIVVESSNDFSSTDHQGGMYWGNVLPGNGLVPNTAGVSSPSVLQKMPGPFWTRSDLTSWGVHNMFSVATHGGSTSESTPTLGAALALVLSEGDQAAFSHAIPARLSGAQAVQVLRESSSQLPNVAKLPWPAPAGPWNPQYGYGMPNVAKAVAEVAGAKVPASPEIDSPAWYSLVDPTRTSSLPVTGSVTAFSGQHYTWQLQYGLGQDPSSWTTISSGAAVGSFGPTRLGSLPVSRIPRSFWSARFTRSTTKSLPTADMYDVTFRLTTSGRAGASIVTGEARRVVDVVHDPSLLHGFPLSIGSSGESQPALVDLQGKGHLDIVFGTADGTVEAIDPATGRELPGWPAHTDPVAAAGLPPGVHAGDEPIIGDVAVGDLRHDGALSVVATSIDGKVYVFSASGRVEPGWPRAMRTGVVAPAIPRPPLAHVRLPAVGALAPPVLVQLGSRAELDIVQAGWDGRIHAWAPTGVSLPGWPVRVAIPPGDLHLPSGYTLEADQKLDTPPAVAYFTKGGGPSLVIRSQYTEITSASFQPLPYSFDFAYSAAGKLLPGWPARIQGSIEDYGSAQEFITEGTGVPASADVLANGTDQVAVGPVWSPPSLLGGNGKVLGTYGSTTSVLSALLDVLENPSYAIFGPLPGTTPTPFTGSGAFGSFGGSLSFAAPEIGTQSFAASLLYPGSGNPIQEFASSWKAGAAVGTAHDAEMARFPAPAQGQDFLGSPILAPVSSGTGAASGNAVVLGGDSGALDAWLSSGSEAPGFPKFTGGWTLYAPSSGDLLGNGHDDVVTVTREGYLLAWSTPGPPPGDSSWWRAFHDEWNSGRLGTDSRPPGVVRSATLSVSGVLRFVAPGAHWYDGTPERYNLLYRGLTRWRQVKATARAGSIVTIQLPAGTTSVALQAANSDDLVSTTVTVRS